MPQIPNFSDDRACPACGHSEFDLKYNERHQSMNLKEKEFMSTGLLEKKCKRCGFRWPEVPLHLAS